MTQAQMIEKEDSTKSNPLYIAFELSNSKWKLMFGNGIKKRHKTIEARDTKTLQKEIAIAKDHFKMPKDVTLYSCYEAGRDGFWLHRYLQHYGIRNIVVDSSSIEVSRHYRRVKTDRVDVGKLFSMLIRYVGGEHKLWRVLHIPTAGQEDARRLQRESERLKKERTAHINRIKSLLILHGRELQVNGGFENALGEMVQWDGKKLPLQLKREMIREYRRLELIQSQLKELEAEKKIIQEEGGPQAGKALELSRLKGIGPVSSWVLVYEFFGWRQFNNVKQVGSAAGLAPTPHASGKMLRELGISKAGNRRVRSTMIEVSWLWLRYQPQSALSRWFVQRFGQGGKRMRRIGIVAMARKLLVALWKYLEKGLVPDGAVFKQIT